MLLSKSLFRTVAMTASCLGLFACQTEAPTTSKSDTSNEFAAADCTIATSNCVPTDCRATGCGSAVFRPNEVLPPSNKELLEESLKASLNAQSGGLGLNAFILPDSDDFDAIPQDPQNPLSKEKVTLGQMFFHDSRFALNGFSDQAPSWSCSTCHTVANGFKPGILQGIGEGGEGVGEQRRLRFGFDPLADDTAANRPDMQPIAVPSMLNVAFQEVVLWNGQLGNASNGLINNHLNQDVLAPEQLPSSVNRHQLAGIESQAIAGQEVHRLRFTNDSPLQNLSEYRSLWNAAYPGGSSDIAVDVAKAIASFERTVFANKAPFQQWLRGDSEAMNESELAGANLFFGKAGCSACHQGPALSSRVGAGESELFFAVGFADFDNNKVAIHGTIEENARLGRGGFTNNPAQNYQFKVPQLYNLADSTVFGHGASFNSIKAVVEYKNKAIPQNDLALPNLDERFQPLNLSIREVNELTTFLSTALHDNELSRYAPVQLPR